MPRHALTLITLLVATLLTGCASQRALEEAQHDPAKLYQLGREALDGGHYETAISHFEKLSSLFPFGEYAQQAQLDTAYAYYRNNEPDSAIAAAEQFIKTYPRHPDLDYAYYLRGLANFGQTSDSLDKLLRSDPAERDPRSALDSFRYFAELIRRFPDSRYAGDAMQRMVHLKNYLARHELYVADHYMRRGAYVAAASRARYVIENYPRTASVPQALEILAQAYDRLGLDELAAATRRVQSANTGSAPKG
ncbi:MAG: outer membrane protein assembly factor BamD [Chromatiales bacterium]|jgi:outer membrane protein assembly factor BamD|nr:outer membrane protein assembly factor BamD [Chromatiales bacterium]